MKKDKKLSTIEDILVSFETYADEPENLKRIRDSYIYAEEKHRGQFRKSGEPYIYHPLAVAHILTEIQADADTLISAILHDIIEDCDVTREDVEEMFGKDVASLVHGVTKLGKIHFSTENDYLIEYYKKIIVGMSEDVRVIIIKLADRLHNMRTLYALSSEKQKKIAKETIEILTPIAHHLGMYKIKSELEDLCLRYLKPEIFYDIVEKLNNTKLERDKAVYEMQRDVSEILNDHNIVHEIKGRSKSIHSIYNKLDKGKKFNDIYDLLALRIYVEKEQECYLALGIIHSKYKPIPKRFKDYVAMPKVNGYQSLHTTVFGSDGDIFEIQIRTYDMDEIAENGVASHWAYKERNDANSSNKTSTEQKLQFFKSIIELSEETMTSEDFVNSVRDEVLNNNIYVFTPKGDIIELSKGSTPIDFAYKVHTKVGETMVGAIVNNNIVPLNYELQNNDIVKINTSKNSNGPSKEWLNIVKSTQTKNKIKAFFVKSEKEVYIERGKDALEKELRKRKLSFSEFFSNSNLETLNSELKTINLEDIYLHVGNNKFSPISVVNTLYKEEVKEIKPTPNSKVVTDNNADIIVDGIDKVKVTLAQCCSPIPGDDIVGFISKNNGITIHRKICHNLAVLDKRLVNVSWNNSVNDKYVTTLMVYTNNRENNLLDLIQKANYMDVSFDRINTSSKGEGLIYEVDFHVRDNDHLNKLILSLTKLSYIDKIERVIK